MVGSISLMVVVLREAHHRYVSDGLVHAALAIALNKAKELTCNLGELRGTLVWVKSRGDALCDGWTACQLL